jgi:hypothetical protein
MAATAVALVGCARSESATEAAFRADHAKCKEYGANPGSDAYAQCRLAIDLQKGNAEAEARGSAPVLIDDGDRLRALARGFASRV